MSKRRYGRKKSRAKGRGKAKNHRKNPKRVAAGKRLARFMAAQRGGKRTRAKGRKGAHRVGRAGGGGYASMLAYVKRMEGTTGLPVTRGEREMASRGFSEGRGGGSSEDRKIEALSERIRKEKRAMAAELVALRRKQSEAEKERKEAEEMQREVDRAVSNL